MSKNSHLGVSKPRPATSQIRPTPLFLQMKFPRSTLENPWTARKSNQSILKEINPEYSLEGLLLKLKPQYLGHPVQRANSLEKTMILGKIEGKRRRGQQRMRWLDNIPVDMSMNFSKLQEIAEDRKAWCTTAYEVAKNWAWLSDWTTAKDYFCAHLFTYCSRSPLHHNNEVW